MKVLSRTAITILAALSLLASSAFAADSNGCAGIFGSAWIPLRSQADLNRLSAEGLQEAALLEPELGFKVVQFRLESESGAPEMIQFPIYTAENMNAASMKMGYSDLAQAFVLYHGTLAQVPLTQLARLMRRFHHQRFVQGTESGDYDQFMRVQDSGFAEHFYTELERALRIGTIDPRFDHPN